MLRIVDILKEEQTECPSRMITSFTDVAGFDHIVFVDNKNRAFLIFSIHIDK